MENKLYGAIKHRMFEEMNQSIQRHPIYASEAKAYHRLHMGKERPQVGVLLRSVSSDRLKLSPDDFIGELNSLVNVANAGQSPGTTIEWVWEDAYNLTKHVVKEDVSATLSTDHLTVLTANGKLTAGPQNVDPATNVAQVVLYINGAEVLSKAINASSGQIWLPYAISPTALIEVSYYYSQLDAPGYYYVQYNDEALNITPMYTVNSEIVLTKTTGTETEADLANSPVLLDYVLNLTTKRNYNSVEIYLERGVDYTVDINGHITFLEPLQINTTLYAHYRWQGADRGPFPIDTENQYVDDAIKGVVLAIGSRRQNDDKQVVILNSSRERMAKVYGGHYIMNFEWVVFTRDPKSTEELADHIVSDIWGNRKEPLRWEGITIQECDASSETEEVYDDATQAMYFQNTITMEIMSEWKKFVPYVQKLSRYNTNITMYSSVDQTFVGAYSEALTKLELKQGTKPFLVEYPKIAYPRYI